MIENVEFIEADQQEVEAPPRGVAFFDLRHGQCNFPVGSLNDPPKWFCGEPALIGKPYCEGHCSTAYVKALRR
jgi:GcrA cell cycle regulator